MPAAHRQDGLGIGLARGRPRRVDDLIRALKPELNETATVLVKGSRFMRMERVVEAIEKREE